MSRSLSLNICSGLAREAVFNIESEIAEELANAASDLKAKGLVVTEPRLVKNARLRLAVKRYASRPNDDARAILTEALLQQEAEDATSLREDFLAASASVERRRNHMLIIREQASRALAYAQDVVHDEGRPDTSSQLGNIARQWLVVNTDLYSLGLWWTTATDSVLFEMLEVEALVRTMR